MNSSLDSHSTLIESPRPATSFDFDTALAHIHRSMQDGADLRLRVARDCGPAIARAAELIVDSLNSGGKLLFFGNGGSAADAQHLAAEFVGRFVMERRGLPAIALTTDSSIVTAIGNDYGFDRVFARQVEALGAKGDVAIGISTSGNSPNVLAAFQQARDHGIATVGLSGREGGRLSQMSDVSIVVFERNTARVQECHIAIGHILCELVESCLFGQRS